VINSSDIKIKTGETKPRTIGRFRNLVSLLHKGREFEFLDSLDSVGIIAIRPDRKIAIVAQDRPPVGLRNHEIPKGMIDKDEDPLDAAIRELKEETGLIADEWQVLLLPNTTSPGQTTERVHLFIARHLTQGAHEREPSEKDMTMSWIDIEEYRQGFKDGDYSDAVSNLAVSTFLLDEMMMKKCA